MKYSNNHAAMNIKIVMGIANINQLAKEISGASGNIMAKIRAKDKLGGVPTRVAIPPIEAL